MTIGEFIFSRIVMVLSIIMILSIPAVCIWPLFHVRGGEVSSIIEDSIKENRGEKFHDVWLECDDGQLKHGEYTISSKREMSLYNKLRNDGIYMKESPLLESVYVTLWLMTVFCVFYCWLEDLFTDDLYNHEKKRLAEFYIKTIKAILKFLGHNSEKVESLELTIWYNERLSFISCFTQLTHSLRECT